MLRLWRRDVPLSERLGEDSPLAAAPSPPPTVAPTGPNISWLPEAPLLSPDQPIFLMTPAAQAVSGFFVWTALILTCHQVTASERQEGGGFGGLKCQQGSAGRRVCCLMHRWCDPSSTHICSGPRRAGLLGNMPRQVFARIRTHLKTHRGET